nr:reverse transcriptase domain-containing protein [Tanacetum cinerariifolium]
MADQRTMVELLRGPTEGYAEVIVVPPILAEQFELKHSLINMMTSDQFFELEKENPHDHILNQQTSGVTTAMTAILKQFQATPPPAFVKAVEEIFVTCGGAQQNSLSKLEKIKRINEANMKAMQTQINNVKNELRNEMKISIQASMSNQTNELKNMMASFFQMNTASILGSGHLPSKTIANPKGELKSITTRSGIVLDGPSVLIPPPFINTEEDEHVKETLTDQDLANVILKKLPEKLRDPGKFLIMCGFSELKCKALADLGASINLMPLSVWENFGLPELISTRMTLELANRAIYTPAGIARDVFVLVGKFTFLDDFVIVGYESDPRVPLILGSPFLRTARALIDVHGEEMILHDGDERLTLNMRHDTSSYSNQPQKESISMINIFNYSSEDFLENLFATNRRSGNPTFSSHPNLTSPEVKDDVLDLEGSNVLIEKLLDLDSTKDFSPSHNVNPLSGSTTSSPSPNHLLEEFADELALITFPLGNNDIPFDIESDLKEIEYLLNNDPIKDMDSILEDSVDEDNLANLNDNLADTMPEMFTEEHAIDYSSHSEIKESKLLIEELDLPRSSGFLPSLKYDSFLVEDFSEIDALPSTNNEDKNVKKLAISHASSILENFDPPIYELHILKEVPSSETLLLFSYENEEKVSNPRF